MKRLALAVALAALASATAPAQEPAADEAFGERIEVREVLLDVLVTDKQGNVVVGLGPGDFVVREDGDPVELTGVTFYSNRQRLDASGQPMAGEVRADRYFVLFFHDRRLDAPGLVPQLMEAGRAASTWIAEDLLANDWVAVVSYDHKLKVHQDFTTDRQALQKAVTSVVKGKDPGGNWASRRPEKTEGPSLLANLPDGKALRRETYNFYKGLTVLGDALEGVPGRKNILLVSPGYGEVNSFGAFTPDARWYKSMLHTLNDNNVAVYAIDLIPAKDGGTNPNRTLNDSLSDLASATGGRYYLLFSNFGTPLEQIEDDLNGYYLLSYRARHPAGESGFQDVDVETKNPSLRVRARQGYTYGRG